MIGFDTFLPEINLEAPGVPESVAMLAIRNAVREFCSVSEIWTQALDPIYAYASVQEYDYPIDDDREVIRLVSATQDGAPVDIKTRDELDADVPGWEAETGTGPNAIIESTTKILVYPKPSANWTDPIQIRAVMRPSMTGTSCGDELLRWAEAIAQGALARLKRIKGKPWSDREAVAVYQAFFRSQMMEAKREAFAGFQQEPLQVIPV